VAKGIGPVSDKLDKVNSYIENALKELKKLDIDDDIVHKYVLGDGSLNDLLMELFATPDKEKYLPGLTYVESYVAKNIWHTFHSDVRDLQRKSIQKGKKRK